MLRRRHFPYIGSTSRVNNPNKEPGFQVSFFVNELRLKKLVLSGIMISVDQPHLKATCKTFNFDAEMSKTVKLSFIIFK